MYVGLVNLVMLFGLVAVLIPVIIHLLNRRRYQVVDWGAMQFLQISQTRRRKLFFEELLLMLLRMGLIAVLVLALAAPYAGGEWVAQFAHRPGRDVVLVIDGSASMGRDDGRTITPHEAAKAWATRFLGELSAGDAIAVILAGQQPAPLVVPLTRDLAAVRDAIARLPSPRGGCDGPRAVRAALDILRQHGQNSEQDIIVLSDGQRAGWFDGDMPARWKKVAHDLAGAAQNGAAPRLWLVTMPDTAEPGRDFPNYSLDPLQSPFAHIWRYQPARFETAITLHGPGPFAAPHGLQLQVDGQVIGELPLPADYPWQSGQVPISFQHRFTTTGPHQLSVILRPDLPPEKRPPDYALRDLLAADNRTDLTVIVRDQLRVLLVDGDEEITAESSTSSLRKVFGSPGYDSPSGVLATTVSCKDFSPAHLTGSPKSERPRVVILADVPALTAPQRDAVGRFLTEGGSVLVAVGARVHDPSAYNLDLWQDGEGWLPTRLEKVGGGTEPEQATGIDVNDLRPPLGLFRGKARSGLGLARFGQWWKLTRPAKGQAAVLATLTSGDPFLVEKSHSQGRVVLSAVPLDHTWASTLPAFPEFPVLMHELIWYLADTGADGAPATASALDADRKESDLALATEAERQALQSQVPVRYEDDPHAIGLAVIGPQHREDIWWLLMLALIGLLCLEILLTRRLVTHRER